MKEQNSGRLRRIIQNVSEVVSSGGLSLLVDRNRSENGLRKRKVVMEVDDRDDLAYIYLKDIKKGEVSQTVALNDNTNFDYDSSGNLLGIELINHGIGEKRGPDLGAK